jgi:hypothetical protein
MGHLRNLAASRKAAVTGLAVALALPLAQSAGPASHLQAALPACLPQACLLPWLAWAGRVQQLP